MITTTTDYVPSYKVKEILGIVKGSTIRAKHIGRDIMAALKNIVGGELKGSKTLIKSDIKWTPAS